MKQNSPGNRSSGKLFFFLYALVLLCDLVFIYLNKDAWRWCTKPLLMPVLIMVLYKFGGSAVFRPHVFAALFFSWCGDLLLQAEGYFIPGLVSFLVAHIFYIIYFLRCIPGFKLRFRFVVPVFVYIAVFLFILFPYLGEMKWPVTFYSITIGIMLLLALHTHGRIPLNISRKFIMGALLFVISDSVLAVNLFAVNLTALSLVVMATYGAAQFLLVRGAMLNTRDDRIRSQTH